MIVCCNNNTFLNAGIILYRIAIIKLTHGTQNTRQMLSLVETSF